MYKVAGYPTAFVMDADGKVLTKIEEALPLRSYVKMLETVRRKNPVK
jgi:hypothetical protein